MLREAGAGAQGWAAGRDPGGRRRDVPRPECGHHGIHGGGAGGTRERSGVAGGGRQQPGQRDPARQRRWWRTARVGIAPHVEYVDSDPRLLDVRYGPNPDPRPRFGSPAKPGAAGPELPRQAGQRTPRSISEDSMKGTGWKSGRHFGPEPDARAPLAGGPDGHR